MERKEKINADLNSNFKILDSLLKMKRFVLEVNYANFSSWGGTVNPTYNFIKVDCIFLLKADSSSC